MHKWNSSCDTNKLRILIHKESGKGVFKSYEMKADNQLTEATISGYKIVST